MNNEFTGRVSAYADESGFKKKDNTPFTSWAIIVEEEVDQYPDSLVAKYYGEKISPPSIGDVVRVGFHYRSSITSEGKIFGQNSIWKLDVLEAAPKAASGEAPQQALADPLETSPIDADPTTPLPF
jgi:hypothetical protein